VTAQGRDTHPGLFVRVYCVLRRLLCLSMFSSCLCFSPPRSVGTSWLGTKYFTSWHARSYISFILIVTHYTYLLVCSARVRDQSGGREARGLSGLVLVRETPLHLFCIMRYAVVKQESKKVVGCSGGFETSADMTSVLPCFFSRQIR